MYGIQVRLNSPSGHNLTKFLCRISISSLSTILFLYQIWLSQQDLGSVDSNPKAITVTRYDHSKHIFFEDRVLPEDVKIKSHHLHWLLLLRSHNQLRMHLRPYLPQLNI